MRISTLVAITLALPLVTAGLAAADTPAGGAQPATGQTGAQSTPEAKAAPKAAGNPAVVLETNYGNIKLELFKDKAPISAENFLSYVRDGFYDGTVFHRVVKGFVIQAGGWTEELDQKEQKAPIKNEAANGLLNLRGTLAVARTNEINSGTSHFFINLKDNQFLDHQEGDPARYGYAVFGKVIEGMDVVDKIAQVEVGMKAGSKDVPVKPVIIVKARIVGPEAPATAVPKAVESKPAEPKTGDKKAPERKAAEKQIDDPESGSTGK